MLTCHHCQRPWNDHAPDCRVPADMARLRRVYDRLVAEAREPELRAKIERYLGLFGNLPCQLEVKMPTAHDCASCGHMEVCGILPPGMPRPKIIAEAA